MSHFKYLLGYFALCCSLCQIALAAPSDVLAQFGKPSLSEVPQERPLKVLVWNIYKTKMPSFYHDFEVLLKDKDLAIIQEAYLDTFFTRIITLKNKYLATFAKSFLVSGEIPTGVMTLSRFNPLTSIYRQSPTTEPVVNTHKMALIQTYQVGQKTLMVANIHAINFVTIESFELQIKDLFKVMQNHRGPILFAGDFNTWSQERMTILNKYIKQLELNDVTFIPDQRKRFFNYPLDHIFVSDDIEILESKTWPLLKGSDHIALEISLQVL